MLLLTMLRGALLMVMPFIPIYVRNIFEYKVSGKYKILLGLFIVSSIVGLLLGTTYLPNVLLSAWIFLPILYLFCIKPDSVCVRENQRGLPNVIEYSIPVILIVCVVGFLVWVGKRGDEFGTAYGRHYEYVHGLALILAFYIFYYFAKIEQRVYNKYDIVCFLLFFGSFVLCDFGLGWICLAITMAIYFLRRFSLKSILIGVLAFLGGYMVLLQTNIGYIEENIDSFFYNQDNARKSIMFAQTTEVLNENLFIVIVGAGPGSYNGRSQMLLTKDSDNPIVSVLGQSESPLYVKYIKPLWNSSFVSQQAYSDGTRNKPFSSFVSILVEYGVFFYVMILFLWIKRMRYFYCNMKNCWEYQSLYMMNLFMFVSCLLHEWFATTEMLFFLIAQMSLLSQIKSNSNENIFCR